MLTASTATGQMLFLPLEAHVVEHSGWRAVTFLVATVMALLLPLVALLVRDRPSDLGLLPYGASPQTPPLEASRQNPVANALRVLRESSHKGDFWLLAGSFFVCTTYTPAWVVAGAICLIAAVVVLRIGRRAPQLDLVGAATPQ